MTRDIVTVLGLLESSLKVAVLQVLRNTVVLFYSIDQELCFLNRIILHGDHEESLTLTGSFKI